jgi:hypothetical protein
MEKRWNKIKERPLTDGLLRVSNRATEIVMKNKSYWTLSDKKELIKHNAISMKYSDSVYFCHIYTVCKSHLCGAIISKPFSLSHISSNYLINGTILGKMDWTTTNLRTSSCAVPVIFSGFNQTYILSTGFVTHTKYKIPRNFVQWGSRCSMTDGHTQTNMMKVIIAVRIFFCDTT